MDAGTPLVSVLVDVLVAPQLASITILKIAARMDMSFFFIIFAIPFGVLHFYGACGLTDRRKKHFFIIIDRNS